jgi:hypothetical protein
MRRKKNSKESRKECVIWINRRKLWILTAKEDFSSRLPHLGGTFPRQDHRGGTRKRPSRPIQPRQEGVFCMQGPAWAQSLLTTGGLLRRRRRISRGGRRDGPRCLRGVSRRRRGWGKSSPRGAPETWNLVSLRIHALLVGVIVSPLNCRPGRIGRVGCHGCAEKETAHGSDGRTGARLAGGGANGRTQPGTHDRADRPATGQILIDGFTCRCSGLLSGPLPAGTIIQLECLEGLALARQNHDAGAGGDRRAADH